MLRLAASKTRYAKRLVVVLAPVLLEACASPFVLPVNPKTSQSVEGSGVGRGIYRSQLLYPIELTTASSSKKAWDTCKRVRGRVINLEVA